MDAAEANRRTLAVYERHAETYVEKLPVDRSVLQPWFDAITTAVPGGHVLELGSGPGLDALELERRGMTVRRTDATVAFVDRLRAQGFSSDRLDARTDDLGGPYDLIFADAVLLHLSRSDLAALLQRATAAAPWLAMTLKEGDGDGWSSRKLGEPRWFAYWRETPLRLLLSESGWDVTWVDHAPGEPDDWIYLVARRV